MKLLITGAGGQLGREWVDFCAKSEIPFLALNSTDLDVSKKEQLNERILDYSPDVIINCAAYTKVDEAEENELQANMINSESVKDLANICRHQDIKLVHFSTDYVFPGIEEDQEQFPNGYPEDYRRNPVNKYGYSKFLGEKVVEESGCNYLLIRVSWLCGKYGNNFVKTMLKLGVDREELNVVNDQFGSPTYTSQVVKEVYYLLRNRISGTFHSTSSGLITWYEFAMEVFKQKDIKVKVNSVSSAEFPTKAKRPSFSKLSTEKISKIEGIKLIDWKVGLKKLLEDLE